MADMIYWFTVDPDLPDVLDVGIRNGLWGVGEDGWDAIAPLEPGDAVLFFQRDYGFVMCEVESEPYTEKVPVWSDVDYPHRVRISDPVQTDRYATLGEVHDCLLDRESGEPFSSGENAAAALDGEDGRFRPLTEEEVRCLFGRLGWALPPDVSPLPEFEGEDAEEGAAGEPADDVGAERAEAEAEPADGTRAAGVPMEDVPEPAQAEPVAPPEDEPGPSSAAGEPVVDREAEAGPEADAAEETGVAAAEPEEGERGEGEPAPPGQGPRVVLASVGDDPSRRRYDETMGEGVEIELLEGFLPDDEMEALRSALASDRVHVWGAAPGEGRESRGPGGAEAGPGDVLLFTREDEVFASARVLLTRRDPDLAELITGGRDDGPVGGTWEQLFLMTRPRAQSVPTGDVDELAGREPGEPRLDLHVLEPARSLRVLGEFPELGAPHASTAGAEGEGGEAADGEMDEARLRVLLFGRRELGRCALCGRLLPVDLLAVVHPKPLEACSPEELEDVGNNVLPACRLGCAGLFRAGFVVVEEGLVRPGRPEVTTEPVETRVAEIVGNRCEFWHSGSEPYFRWHAGENPER